MWIALLLPAFAQELPRPWQLSATASTGFVSGVYNQGGAGETLSGGYSVDPSYNPGLSFGLSIGGAWRFSEEMSLQTSWSLSRELRFCDTCEEGGYDPGIGGATSSRVVEASDLQLRWQVAPIQRWEGPGIDLSGALTGALPASRDALFCNPFYGAIGGEIGASKGLSAGESLGLKGGVSRSFFAYTAPPLGREGCSAELSGYEGTETLSGTVWPDEAVQDSAVSLGNADWSLSGALSLADPHAALARIFPGLSGSWYQEHLDTRISAGLIGRHTLSDGEASVETLDGEAEIAKAESPLVWSYPISLTVGVSPRESWSAGVVLANATPRLLYDPAAYYRYLPAQTSLSLLFTGTY